MFIDSPLIISASRATDIPAHYADWFMERLRDGHCLWTNPFNSKQKQIISFAKCKGIVFWSKHPKAILPYLRELSDRGLVYYFQFTLNNYEKEKLEPGLPSLAERIELFVELSQSLGKSSVIWRYDPIIMGSRLTVQEHLARLEELFISLGPYTEKMIFSFLDIYNCMKKSLAQANPNFHSPTPQEQQELVEGMQNLQKNTAPHVALACCGEAETYGVAKANCVDANLLNKLYDNSSADEKLILRSPGPFLSTKHKGQRPLCNCCTSKDIGSYRQQKCAFACAYCYAGHAGRKNL